jgi:Domain of unknown function (DUF1963)
MFRAMPTVDDLRKKLRADLKVASKSYLSALSDAEIDDIPRATEVNRFIDMLVRESKPVATLRFSSANEPDAGISRIIGRPDLPSAFDWPEHLGIPMAFLAQLDLASLPADVDWPTPKTGWLYLFIAEAMIANDSVQRKQDVVVSGYYFGGSSIELRPRSAPANVAQPSCLAKVLPQLVSFGLELCPPITEETFTGYSWEEAYPNCHLLLGRDETGNELELDTESLVALLPDHEDRFFGYRHFNPDQIVDARMWAAIRGAGFRQIALYPETATATLKTYNAWDVPEASKREFETFVRQRDTVKAESAHWDQLLSFGTSCGFNWGPFASALQVFADRRKSIVGDFSNLQSFNRHQRGYD